MNTVRRNPAEVGELAVRLVFENTSAYCSLELLSGPTQFHVGAIRSVAEKIGYSAEGVR